MTVSRKRLDQIDRKLSARQIALDFILQAIQTHDSFAQYAFTSREKRIFPRDMLYDRVLESAAERLRKTEAPDRALAGALMQADFLYLLAIACNEILIDTTRTAKFTNALLAEQLRSILIRTQHEIDVPIVEILDWRTHTAAALLHVYQKEAANMLFRERYFAGHTVIFRSERNAFDHVIATLLRLIGHFENTVLPEIAPADRSDVSSVRPIAVESVQRLANAYASDDVKAVISQLRWDARC